VVYVNSTAEIKAFCGELGGSTCTSSNAASVFRWVLDQNRKVFFLPDEHLGVNTARDLGLPPDKIAVFDPARSDGGLQSEHLRSAAVVVWKGYCLVHTAFTVEHVEEVRKRIPNARIIVHPEAPREVVALCDAHGSTSQIVKYVESAADGETIIIGTELNLVERLAEQNRHRVTVKALAPSVCANMARTNESNLLELLEKWPVGNEIHVDQAIARDGSKALGRMLNL
jgi:quinolinate synthase